MTSNQGLFQIIVLGGIALVATESCGGKDRNGAATGSATGGQYASQTTGGFPSELPVQYLTGGSAGTGGFPSELPAQYLTGGAAGAGGFPLEGPLPLASGGFPETGGTGGRDAGADAAAGRDGAAPAGTGGQFPRETALP